MAALMSFSFLIVVCFLTVHTASWCLDAQDTKNGKRNSAVQSLQIPIVPHVFRATKTQKASTPYINLLKAYPDHIDSVNYKSVYWKDGVVMPLGKSHLDALKRLNSYSKVEALLDSASLRDQIEAVYPSVDSIFPPRVNSNPGRFRFEPFFHKMYGKTEAEVRKHLVPVRWMRNSTNASTTLLVTRVNGVDKKLRSISDELERLPHKYIKYLEHPGGTFSWRTIAGSKRQSAHSFGMTIDINVQYSDYWRWNINKNASAVIPYKNRIPLAIVRIFEKHGFIWGGRWYHYDTMHFEYRPELLSSIGRQNLPVRNSQKQSQK